MKGRTLFPDSTLITNTLDYQIKKGDELKAEGQTEQGHLQTQFLTSVKDETDHTHVNQVEALTDLEESFGSGQLAIKYRLPEETNVKIRVWNILGQQIKELENNTQRPGNYHTYWNFTNDNQNDVADGHYFYTIETEDGAVVHKFNLVNGNIVAGAESIIQAQRKPEPLQKTNATYTISFTDTSQTVKPATFNVELPDSSLDVFLQELIRYENTPYTLNEGDTLQIPLADFSANTGPIQDASVNNPELDWFIANRILNIYNKDSSFAGNRNIPVKITATHGTDSTFQVQATWQDLIALSGKIVDNDFYRKLEDGSTGPPLPGYVTVIETGDKIHTDDGLFSLKVTPRQTVNLQAQHIIGTDTLSFASTHTIPATHDSSNIILHPITSYGMEEGQMPLFKMFYFKVNDKQLNLHYSGKSYIDKNPETHRIVIPLINDLGDTMTVADQDSVENYLLTRYFDDMQNPPPIIKQGLNDPDPWGQGGGQWVIYMRPDGSNSGAAADYNDDGIIDEALTRISKAGGPQFRWGRVAQELLTGEAAPNNLNDLRLENWTVLDGSTLQLSGELFPFDYKLRKIGENYPPKEELERILGNITMLPP